MESAAAQATIPSQMLSSPVAPSTQHPIAFFCAEFGIDQHLPIYAGGLGILAGDLLKEAADQNLPYVGVGLLYRGGGSVQQITSEGKQLETDLHFDPLKAGLEHVYVDEMPLFIKVHLTEKNIWLRCWQKKIGETVTLYLLDPDTEQNEIEDRKIANILYAGTEEEVIKQQLLLGIGGVKLLHGLGIHPALYHVNEGRPAFLHWQLIRASMDGSGLTFQVASEMAKQKTVYTNHTLVEAGNQQYRTHLLRAYGTYYAEKMGVTIDELLEPGLDDKHDRFSMTQYALKTSRKASAVSQVHLDFCQDRWPGFRWVGVTNGVHMKTWQATDIAEAAQAAESVEGDTAENAATLWHIHQHTKRELMNYVFQRTGFQYDPQRLVITWARRVTGYKQLPLIFSSIDRLAKILQKPGQEVQLLIAGKAHRDDSEAKQEVEAVIQHMQHELSGYALFVPNLDMELDMMLTRGSDVWLNTPLLGLEACGTSGMKALANGVLQCTTADGWVPEVNWENMGWILESHLAADSFYETMEKQIQPLFYERDTENVPTEWVARMQKGILTAKQFSAERMLREYQEKLYVQ